MKKRNNHTWNLSPLFKSDTDPLIEISQRVAREATKQLAAHWHDRTDWLADSKTLKQALDEYECWARDYGASATVSHYYGLRLAQEQNNSKLKAVFDRACKLSEELSNDIEFFTNRLAKIPKAGQNKMLATPKLARYRSFLRTVFAGGDYVLSEAEEKILTLKNKTSHAKWVMMLDDLLARETRRVMSEKGKKISATLPILLSLVSSPKKKVRAEAGRAVDEILERWSLVAEAEFNAILADKETNDGLRGFKRPDDARLLGDDIEAEVVDAMLEAVEKSFALSARFYRLKARLLGQRKLSYPERNVPVGRLALKHTWADSVRIVRQAMARLDPEFTTLTDRFLDRGWVDVFPRRGKSDGAFCSSNLISHPTYILLNHTGTIRDTTTFAHELGHGINSEMMKTSCHSLDFGLSMATAEVASTFFEDFALEEIAKNLPREAELSILMNKLNDDISTIFRQVAAYRFEQEVHQVFRQKGYLAKEEIGRIFSRHMQSYLGGAVKLTPENHNWWIYWGHFRNYFYVYSYASGLLISKALQERVRANPQFIKKIKDFLKAGTSDSPKNIFKKLGIDITDKNFWLTGLKGIEKDLKRAEKLAKSTIDTRQK